MRNKIYLLCSGLTLVTAGLFFRFAPVIIQDYRNPVVNRNPSSFQKNQTTGKIFVADLHNDVALWKRNILEASEIGHSDLPRMQRGGLNFQVFSTVSKFPILWSYEGNTDKTDIIFWLGIADLWPLRTWFSLKERTLYQGQKIVGYAEQSDSKLRIVKSRNDLLNFMSDYSQSPDLVAGLLSIEGLHALDSDLKNIEEFFVAGFRMMGIAHMFDNDFGGSFQGTNKLGLTTKGRDAITLMEKLGITVDLSHLSNNGFREALEIATKPVVVSHAGVMGVCKETQNLSDEELKVLAANGGVIGIGYWREAICGNTVNDIAKAIKYAVDIAGIDHVALGSDFDGAMEMPFDVTHMPDIYHALENLGIKGDDLAKVMGLNVVRVLQANLPH